ncbi:WD40/YVTN/BNR-like repeat-containing protein [Thalassolituus sp. LLYu03]|uniref:WD40/YVTN/BNR-like repeat-containing protein n=1 Tax=Thalassolituus sp. LLYu03 TaxID=3421656 RepID=UPI003D28AA23
MFSDLVQCLTHASGKALATGLTRVLLSSIALLSPAAFAGWQDPLNTPALQTERAHETLLLDVVRADQRLVAVGGHGHVVYSDDDGSTWRQGKVPVSVTLVAAYFPSGDFGWAVGHDGVILRTTDGGKNWAKQFDGYQANDEIVAAATRTKERAQAQLDAAETAGDDVAIEDAEMALEAATYALQDAEYDKSTGSTKPFMDVWFYDAKRGFAVGAYGMFFATENGGESWEDVSSRLPNPDRLHLNAITPVGAHSLVVVGEMGMILRSDDLGQTWHQLESPYDGSLFGLLAQGSHQLLFGLRGHVYNSTDGGISWNELSTGSEQTLLSGVIGHKHTLLVGNGGSVVVFDSALNNPVSTILEGRKAYAAVAEASDGNYVIVGEAGVKRLNAAGEMIDQSISMAAGDF